MTGVTQLRTQPEEIPYGDHIIKVLHRPAVNDHVFMVEHTIRLTGKAVRREAAIKAAKSMIDSVIG